MRNRKITFITIICAMMLSLSACGKNSEIVNNETVKNDDNSLSSETVQTSEPVSEKENTGTTGTKLELPIEADDGRLLITSVFQSDIDNPDCGEEYAEQIASIEVTNVSGQFLESANLQMILADGTEYTFVLDDIPAEKKIWAFDTKNTVLPNEYEIVQFDCEAEYLTDDPTAGYVITSVEGMEITVENLSSSDAENIEIVCHSQLDGTYFGGVAYTYMVDKLSAGATETVIAADCYMDTADVVKISLMK